MSPRQRRLAAEFKNVKSEFAGHRHVVVEWLGSLPPEIYRVTFKVPGLRLNLDQPLVVKEHRCEIRLPRGYPAESPYVVPITSIFHPNIARSHYCIGDYWWAEQPLSDIIRKIGDMIQFRLYNVDSALNADAAEWTRQNERLLPIGQIDLGTPDADIEIKLRAPRRKGRLEIDFD